jgi:chemotaxis protein CheD
VNRLNQRYSNKFKRKIYEIFAGEYYVIKSQPVILQTLLGSCVSVCLKDKFSGIVGINHFMLPGGANIEKIIYDADSRYGINSMELLINGMMKLGAIRKGLQAKVFGGGKVVANELNNVGQANIDFVDTYLNMEQIPVLARDLGSNHGRKILFFPDSFTVLQKKIEITRPDNKIVKTEKRYLKDSIKESQKESELTLFE